MLRAIRDLQGPMPVGPASDCLDIDTHIQMRCVRKFWALPIAEELGLENRSQLSKRLYVEAEAPSRRYESVAVSLRRVGLQSNPGAIPISAPHIHTPPQLPICM